MRDRNRLVVVLAVVAVTSPAAAMVGNKAPAVTDCATNSPDPVGADLHNLETSVKPLPFYLHATGAERFAKQRVLHRFYLNDMRTLPKGIPTVGQINQVLARKRGKGPYPEADMAYLLIPDSYKNQTATTIPSPVYILRETQASRQQEDSADVCNAPERRKVIIHAPGVNQVGRRIWSHAHTWSDVQAMYATLENDYPHWASSDSGTNSRMFGRNAALKNTDIRYYQTLQNNNESVDGPLANLNTSSMAEMIGNLVFAYTRGMSDVYVWTHSNGVIHTHKAWEIFVRMFDEAGAPNGLSWGQYWYGLRKANGYTDKMNVWYYHDQAATGVSSFMFFGDWHNRDIQYGEDEQGIVHKFGFAHLPFDILEALGTRAFDNGKVAIKLDFIYNFADSMTAQAGGFVNPHETIGQKPSRFGMTAVNLAAQLNRQTENNGRPVLWRMRRVDEIQLRHEDVDPSQKRFVAEDLYAYGTSSTKVADQGATPMLKVRYMLPCGTAHQQVLAPWATTESNRTLFSSGKRPERSGLTTYNIFDQYPYADGWRDDRWQWSVELSEAIEPTPENERGLRCTKQVHPGWVNHRLKLTYCDYNLCVYPYFPDPTGQTDSCKENKDCPPELPFCNGGVCGVGTCGQYGKQQGWTGAFCDMSPDHSYCEPNKSGGSAQTVDGCTCCNLTCDQLVKNRWGTSKGWCEPPSFGLGMSVPPLAACAGEKYSTSDCATGCCQPTCQQLVGNHPATCDMRCPGGSSATADCNTACCACGDKGQICCAGNRCAKGATCDATGMCN